MNDRKLPRAASAIIPILAVLIFSVAKFSDQLQASNLLIPLIILIFVIGFGFFAFQVIKLWKNTDREIVSDYLLLAASLFVSDAKETKVLVQRFLAVVAFVIFVFIKMRNGSPVPYIFCGIALLISGLPLLRALLGWNRDTSEEQAYREGALMATLIGLITSGFICAFMAIGIWHGVWWFVCPPGLIFLGFFSRPLVAGLRILFRKEKDPGEKHINKRKDSDPWDRPDRKL